MKDTIWRDRVQSVGEEIANSVSHGVGLAGSLAVTPILIVAASRSSGMIGVAAVTVFGVAMILMYLMSTLYHALPESRAKRLFNILDHSAIYVLIAGTYTPFMLVALGGAWGWSLFGLVWSLAAAGVFLKLSGHLHRPVLSTAVYVSMGWLVGIAIRPLWAALPMGGMVWLVAGGLAYTLGVLFFAAAGLRYSHFAWHLFVLVGTACHCVAVLGYAV